MEDKQVEEIKRHFGVIAESLRDEIKLVAEGHGLVRKDIQTVRGEMRNGFDEMKASIKTFRKARENRLMEIVQMDNYHSTATLIEQL
jgi:t-SNARE complex subunit (syntaxin)